MEALKEELREYIFEEYMGSSNYVYAKGVNWIEIYYDNLTAEEIWNVMEDYEDENEVVEGTMFDKAQYLSMHAPIKDNWEELFMENWEDSIYYDPETNEIEKMVDKGDSVLIFTEALPYEGEGDNHPFVTLDKRTGYWHG